MTHVFVWRLEDVFGLAVLGLALVVMVPIWLAELVRKWRKK